MRDREPPATLPSSRAEPVPPAIDDPPDQRVVLERLEEAKDLLVRAGHELAASLDVATTFQVLSHLTVPQFADWYAVHLVDEHGVPFPTHIAHANPQWTRRAWEAVERWSKRGGDTVVQRVISSGESVLIPTISASLLDQAARDSEHREALKLARLNSAMVVPLRIVDGSIIGTMMFIAAESQRRYGPDDLTLALALADRAAVAISNARLHEQATEARRRAEQAVQRLDLLMKASSAIAGSLELDDALRRLAEFAVITLADYCITYRQDADGTIRRVGLAHADPTQRARVEALERAGPPRLNDPFGAGRVLREGRSLFTAEISPAAVEAVAVNDAHRHALLDLAPRSSMVVPLKARGHSVGAVTFATTDYSNRRYGPTDLALVEELADRVALQIDNVRLYTEASHANEAKEEMLAVVSHDLRSPLSTVITACELLDLEISEAQRGEIHDSIRRAARQMQRLVEDLLDTTQIDQGQLTIQPAPLDLTVLVTDLIAMHTPVARSRSIALAADFPQTGASFVGDAARLTQALGNLIDNALRVTPNGGQVRIRLSRQDGALHLAVSDTGPGMDEEALERLFDRFWRSRTATGRGAGLGLAIAKGIVEAHGGTIRVTSRPGAGACFTLVLPDAAALPGPTGEN